MTEGGRAAVECAGLTKDYGLGRGIFDLDLQVEPGEVFGFLGPNGAGKTTTIRLLMGLIRATAGAARIFGLDCERDAVAVKKRVGYLPGELPQYGGWRGGEVVAYLAGLRGGVADAEVRRIAERFALDLGRKYREYSRGNKQKLALVIAFMHRPGLLILDEPTAGLDPLLQQEFNALLRETKERGATVFLSSHVLSEVEQTCDRAAIVREGRLAVVAPVRELRSVRARQVEIRFAGPVPLDALAATAGVEITSVAGDRVHCVVRGSMAPLLSAIAGHHVVDLTSQEPTLEEAFLTYYETAPTRG